MKAIKSFNLAVIVDLWTLLNRVNHLQNKQKRRKGLRFWLDVAVFVLPDEIFQLAGSYFYSVQARLRTPA